KLEQRDQSISPERSGPPDLLADPRLAQPRAMAGRAALPCVLRAHPRDRRRTSRSSRYLGTTIAIAADGGDQPPRLRRKAPRRPSPDGGSRGRAVTAYTSRLVLRARYGGDEVGNHIQNHLSLADVPVEEVEAESAQTHELLGELLGSKPAVIRPPYGLGSATVNSCASALGY